MSNSIEALPFLPPEIWCQIGDNLSNVDWNNLSLTSKYLNQAVVPSVPKKMERIIEKYKGQNVMDSAARDGHLEVVKLLHEYRKVGCSKWGMDWAAENGHIEVVKWLHENRKEGCSTWAMNWAARYGHLEVVKWLHDNRKEGCTIYAMNYAASKGHKEVVKYLKENVEMFKKV